jgi:ABC-type uncharacterized transport system involved in gliding motility auxiliary subunit
MISKFGVRIDNRILMDTQMATLAIPRDANFMGLRVQMSEPVQRPVQIRVLGDQLNHDLPFNAGVGELLYLWGNQVVVDEAGLQEKGLTETTLFTGGDVSWSVDMKSGPLALADMSPEGHPMLDHPPLGVLVEGVFPAPWDGKPAPEWPNAAPDSAAADAGDEDEAAEAGPEPEPQAGRLVVIGCSKMFEDMLLNQAGHALFLLNTVDALTLGDDLISIRSKKYEQRTFGEVSDGGKLTFRIVNIALVPLLVAGFGIGNRLRRKREAEEYAAKHSRTSGGAKS